MNKTPRYTTWIEADLEDIAEAAEFEIIKKESGGEYPYLQEFEVPYELDGFTIPATLLTPAEYQDVVYLKNPDELAEEAMDYFSDCIPEEVKEEARGCFVTFFNHELEYRRDLLP